MYTSLRLRSQHAVEDVFILLEDMALVDPRTYLTHTASEPLLYAASTVTTPSLSRRETVSNAMDNAPLDGGNVKVVVRVRKFLQRGRSQHMSGSQRV